MSITHDNVSKEIKNRVTMDRPDKSLHDQLMSEIIKGWS